MAKKKTTRSNGNKSDVIRGILKKNPKANVKAVQATLRKRGIKASDALVNKIKYGRGTNGAARSAKRGKGRGNVNKADAIRGAWRELGLNARPRDVIALLASRGLTVTSAQVSTLRKSAKAGRRAGSVALAHGVPYEHLLEAKGLAARLGGVENARAALDSFAELVHV